MYLNPKHLLTDHRRDAVHESGPFLEQTACCRVRDSPYVDIRVRPPLIVTSDEMRFKLSQSPQQVHNMFT